jgi:hypothetical protein
MRKPKKSPTCKRSSNTVTTHNNSSSMRMQLQLQLQASATSWVVSAEHIVSPCLSKLMFFSRDFYLDVGLVRPAVRRNDLFGSSGVWFIFDAGTICFRCLPQALTVSCNTQDINIRLAGDYSLKFRLYNLETEEPQDSNKYPMIGECFSAPFTVFTAREFVYPV